MLEYCYNAYEPSTKKQIVDMAINSSGIRDTAKTLQINKNTVISTLKNEENSIVQVSPMFHPLNVEKPLEVRLDLLCKKDE